MSEGGEGVGGDTQASQDPHPIEVQPENEPMTGGQGNDGAPGGTGTATPSPKGDEGKPLVTGSRT